MSCISDIFLLIARKKSESKDKNEQLSFLGRNKKSELHNVNSNSKKKGQNCKKKNNSGFLSCISHIFFSEWQNVAIAAVIFLSCGRNRLPYLSDVSRKGK